MRRKYHMVWHISANVLSEKRAHKAGQEIDYYSCNDSVTPVRVTKDLIFQNVPKMLDNIATSATLKLPDILIPITESKNKI